MVIAFGLAENIAATEAFIAIAPVELVLVPKATSGDGTGGKLKTPGTPRSPQTFTLVEPGSSGYQEHLKTDQGRQNSLDFLLLGMPDAEMAEGDVFTYEAVKYRVETIMPFNGYERRALVIRYGE